MARCDVRVVNGDVFELDVPSVVVPIECSLTFAHSLGQELLRPYGNEVRLAALEAKASLPEGASRWAVVSVCRLMDRDP